MLAQTEGGRDRYQLTIPSDAEHRWFQERTTRERQTREEHKERKARHHGKKTTNCNRQQSADYWSQLWEAPTSLHHENARRRPKEDAQLRELEDTRLIEDDRLQ